MTTIIDVPEIHCDHCRTSIEGALRPLDGVSDATVDVEARTVSVAYDAATIDLDVIIDAIEGQGYDVPAQD